MNGRLSSAFSRRQTSKPSSLGHHHIEQDGVGQMRARGINRCFAVDRGGRFVALRGEARFEDRDIVVVVVDDEDKRRLAHGYGSIGRYSRTLASSWRGLKGLAT